MDGRIVFKGVNKSLFETIPDIFPYGYTTDLELAIWAYHAQKVSGKTHEEIEKFYNDY